MKTIESVTIYKCDFCKKELKRKHAMVKHEDLCNNNPKNIKACHFCNYLEVIEKELFFENRNYHPDYSNDDGQWKKAKVFRCKKLDKLMFPFSIEKRGLHKEWSTYEEQEPMPILCAHFVELNNY